MTRKPHIALIFLTLLLIVPFSAHAEMVDHPNIKLQALNKSTARTETFEAKVGDTIEYGSLFIRIQSCRKSEPLDKPEDAAFLQIWEVPIGKEKSEWAFSGWMFSSSPAVSAMDHAIYDVWVLECFDPNKEVVAPVNKIIVNDEEYDPTAAPENEEEGALEQSEELEERTEEVLEEALEEELTTPITLEDNASNDTIEYETAPETDYNSRIIEAEPLSTVIDNAISDDTIMYE